MADTSLQGRLLVATPALREATFARAVVLILEHTGDGAFGLVLNQPMGLSIADAVAGWESLAAAPSVIFTGGPVAPSAAIGLATPSLAAASSASRVWRPLLPNLAVVDLTEEPTAALGVLDKLRVFAGYAGWGPGQLEGELAEQAWYVVDSRPDDVFSERPEQLWGDVLRRQSGEMALLATMPPDPSMN